MNGVGGKIQQYRRHFGMSQYDLAKDICSQSNISKIEKGLHTPSLFLLSNIAERLNVPIGFLYSDEIETSFEVTKKILYQYLEEQRYSELSDIVDNYPDSYQSLYEKKFILWMRAVAQDTVHKNRKKANIYLDMADNIVAEVQDDALELGIMNIKTIIYRDVITCKEMKELFSEMFHIIVTNNIVDKLTIKTLLAMSTYCYHKKFYKHVKEYSSYAVKLLKNKQDMYLLDYHLYNLSSAMYYLGEVGQLVEEQLQVAKTLAHYNNNDDLFNVIEEFQNKKNMKGVI